MSNQPSHAKNRNNDQGAFVQLNPGIEDRDLRIEVFAVCDSAVEQDGRLSLAGTYEVVNSPAFPIVIPQITVALRLRFWPGERTRHLVRLSLTSPDGLRVGGGLEGEVTLSAGDPERSGAYNLIVHARDIPIEEPGEYTMDFHLNDRLEGRLPICFRRSMPPHAGMA